MKPKVELGPKRAFLKARSMYFHYLYISSSFCYIFSLHIMIIPKLQKSNCSSTTFSWQNNPFFKLPTVQHHSFLPLQGKSQVSQRVGATYTTLIAIYTIEYNKNKNKATHQIVLQTQWLTIAKHSSSFTNHDIWISSQSNFLSRIYHDLCILRLIINQATIVKYNYISKTHKPSMSMRILQVMDTHRRSTKLAFFNIDNLPSLGSWN